MPRCDGTMRLPASDGVRDAPRAGNALALCREVSMSESSGFKLGQKVPDFELTTYDPVKDDFGRISLAGQIASKRWTVLFFYPADFTFV
jgi:hypothetical protein